MLVSASFYCIFCIKDCNLSLLRVEIIGLVSYLRREGKVLRRGGEIVANYKGEGGSSFI